MHAYICAFHTIYTSITGFHWINHHNHIVYMLCMYIPPPPLPPHTHTHAVLNTCSHTYYHPIPCHYLILLLLYTTTTTIFLLLHYLYIIYIFVCVGQMHLL